MPKESELPKSRRKKSQKNKTKVYAVMKKAHQERF
jgi:hypothetical protein